MSNTKNKNKNNKGNDYAFLAKMAKTYNINLTYDVSDYLRGVKKGVRRYKTRDQLLYDILTHFSHCKNVKAKGYNKNWNHPHSGLTPKQIKNKGEFVACNHFIKKTKHINDKHTRWKTAQRIKKYFS